MYHYVQVQFEGATGTVAFDNYGRRRKYKLDVLEHRLDNEMFKVPLYTADDVRLCISGYR